MKGLKRVLKNHCFTSSEKIQKQLEEYELENNPIKGFIAETDEEDIIHQSTADVYRRYQVYCQETATTPMSKQVFSKQMNRFMRLKVVQRKVQGKNLKIFERDE